ncbi:AAA family ATPase [Belliella sp. R4-6]|uniref:AAA family ATPase n=1 Tax=Belliella alkalica TaxID=1730871 RepID=A0ABS9VHE7_9BACT|nr:AAA domain-containing protein [Belliella alkalica]MCH7415867.1 AAA family ATPase [Belliella alkalica]
MPLHRDLIYIDHKDVTDRVKHFRYGGGKCHVVFKNGEKEYAYSKDRAVIIKTALSKDGAFQIFQYLKEIAEAIGLKNDRDESILAKSYGSISHIPNDSILSFFLNGSLPSEIDTSNEAIVFPFGFNSSQKAATNLAFSNKLSIIEGPPGTGKTQTILNIIANAVMTGKSVAVVSSNNAATRNVYEKLEKYGLEFIAAPLGKAEYKKNFIDNQEALPDLSEFYLTPKQQEKLNKQVVALGSQLSDFLEKKNRLALLKMEIENTVTEYQHFRKIYQLEPVYIPNHLDHLFR